MTSKYDPAEDDDLKDLQEMMDEDTKEGGTELFLELLGEQAEEMVEAARAKYPHYLPARRRRRRTPRATGAPRVA
jgi:hypothetical protein